MSLEILSREVVYRGYMTVERLRVRLADGAVVIREVERHGDAVAVLPYDADRAVALTARLFRAPAFALAGEAALEEACAGMIDPDDGDDAAGAARREALEELGVRLGDLEFVGRVWSSPGVSAERVSLFLATFVPADRIAVGGGVADEHEGIVIVERALVDLASDADGGRVSDMKLLVLTLALRTRRPDLFSQPTA